MCLYYIHVEVWHDMSTNMHIDMDYDILLDELPEHIRPAYDGMVLRFDAP